MKKKVLCKNCKQEICVRGWSDEWEDFSREKGETFELNCKKCGKSCEYRIYDVYAVVNSMLNLFLFFIVLVLIGVIVYYLYISYWGKSFYAYIVIPIVIAIPVKIYFTYIKSESIKVRNFNRLSRFKNT